MKLTSEQLSALENTQKIVTKIELDLYTSSKCEYLVMSQKCMLASQTKA